MDPKLTILHVEDNPAHAELVSRGLEALQIDLDLILFKDGMEIINHIHDITKPLPQMILLDLNLPKVKGLEVLKQIRESERHHATPVIILSTSEAKSDIERAYEKKANSYLVKPLDFDNFQTMIVTCGRYWINYNQTLTA